MRLRLVPTLSGAGTVLQGTSTGTYINAGLRDRYSYLRRKRYGNVRSHIFPIPCEICDTVFGIGHCKKAAVEWPSKAGVVFVRVLILEWSGTIVEG